MDLAALDRRLLVLARTTGHTPARERGVAAVSKLGEHALVWIGLGASGGLLAPAPARRRAWWRGVQTVLAAYAANQALKFSVRRPRPQLPELPQLTGTHSQLSFPSAHATTSWAAVRAYRGLLPAPLRLGLAAVLSLSRPWLGVHYPSDVLAGAILGTSLAAAGSRAGARRAGA